MAEFELKALITGVDRLSPALSKMQKKIRGFKRQAEEASQGGLALGGGLAAGLTLSLKSYADQENAATGLKVAMMDANGEVGKSFQDINKLAIGLGNQLPGTTADFQNMMQMLVRQGIPAENILGGVGKATAYLAVQLKKTPEAAAEFAAKMQDATGTASEDMMGLFDTIQKAFYLGVDDTNMLSFFTKTSSVLKMVNKDGLQAAQSLAPISVMMDQMGMNGESAGNALRKVIQSGLSVKKIRDVNKIMARQKLGVQLDFTDGKGSFGGLDNMFRQLAKLRKLTDVNEVASTLRTTAISEAAYAVTRLPAPTTSAVMQNAAVGQSTTPAQSTGWPSATHPALNNAPAVKNTVDLPTWEELTDIRDTLNTAIDKELSRTTSDALFLALRRVKADLNADINTRLEQSARIIQRTPDEVLPALVLAATWFDNAARDADIIRRNAITHPGFVPVIPLKVPVQ